MKQIKTAILTIAAALTLSSCNYNGMVEREEAVSQAWSNVENQYPAPDIWAHVHAWAFLFSSTFPLNIRKGAES